MAGRLKSLRRTASTLVREWVTRPDVRVHRAEERPLASRPTFVLGVFRSGTTLLRFALDSHPRLAVPPESEFLRVLEGLVADERAARGLQGMGFDEAHVLGRAREFAAYFFENYAASRGRARWVDKSPIYVEHLDFLHRLFPNAQYLTIYRHGLSQAWSVTGGGAHRGFHPLVEAAAEPGDSELVGASRYWASRCAALLDFEEAHADRCHRLTYEGLCADPDGVLRGVLAFLDEPWDDAVVRFAEHEHDRGMEDGTARASRGFSPAVDHAPDWSEEDRERALEWVGPVWERVTG